MNTVSMNTKCDNPILPGFYPDPTICRVGDDYYLATSTFCYFPGVPIFHSKDLVNWKQIGNILDRPSQIPLKSSNIAGMGIYAPTLRYHDGTFYMITTNVGSSLGNFIVTATDPAGPWSDPYPLGSEGIDPSLFFDDDGKCYYCGTRDRREGARYYGDNEIYIQELDLETMTLVGESWAAWHGALKEVEWPEGPHIYKKDGWYYLLISEAGTGHMHCVTVARSKSLKEPFTGYPGNPILTHRHLGMNYPIVNVGHPDIVETQNGEWWMVALASRPYGGGYYRNLGRETFLVPFTWENGWPLINPGKGIVEEQFTRPDLPASKPKFECKRDDFEYDILPYEYMFVRNPDMNMYSLSDKPGHIALTPSPERLDSSASPTVLCKRQTSMDYELSTSMMFTPDENESAGLILLQNEFFNYHFGVTKENGEYKIIVRKSTREDGAAKTEIIGEHIIENASEPLPPIDLYAKQIMQSLSFRCIIGDRTNVTVAENADASILCTDTAGGFVGTCLGIYAESAKVSDNKAYFDFLTVHTQI